ncbi:Postreplication repair E3 ubiquitin-protein ligase rad18 [Lachnellula suecica]|uniref:Postreplication repair E3 ubiquitin-protein ligase RAD18 n=1 Tax=Lachnellula suecica TaxID=602035 RepID=A0A8T9C0Q9_9HELO|nr:Postreplication repair E3 ubiquitin-protein ligase rad18 [Lachnellula suecica]
MNGKAPKDDSFEVLDSTDWLATPLPKLSAVEAALRCQVCKDFYTSPMITSCSHTFCSLCIRRALGENGKCPGCRAPEQELKLRFNGAVYDMVEAFKAARPEVLEYTKERPIPPARTASPKRSRELANLEGVEEGPSAKRTRSSRRIAQPQERVMVLDSDAEDEDFVPEEGFIECPVCQKMVKLELINPHLDRGCMDEPTRPKTGRIGPLPNTAPPPPKETKRPERLAQLNYSMVKDVPLRKKLTDQGLSAAGSRQMLERRYAEWITLWNSNCDARIPKGKNELRRELEVWEKTQGGRASATVNPGAQIKEKDFDGKAWASQHDDSFRDLIANARRKLPPKPVAPPPHPDESTIPEPSNIPEPVGYISPYGTQSVNQGTDGGEASASGQLQAPLHQISNGSQTLSELPNGSQRRYFDEGVDNNFAPPSSQYSNGIPVLQKDTSIASDITTIRTVQP